MAKKVKRKEKQNNVENEAEQNSGDLNEKKVTFTEDTVDNSDDGPPKKKSKKRKDEVVIKSGVATEEELTECNKPENKKAVVSKRQEKKKKYDDLKAQQKLDSEVAARQKNLNYLSLWKHNKSEWKFEKLKQNWLQKHMFDEDMIPNEHWNTLIEYFSGAKGQIRQTVLKECMDVVEKSESPSEESVSDESNVKFTRARDMLQSLDE